MTEIRIMCGSHGLDGRKVSPLFRTWLGGKSETFLWVRGRPGLAGLDENMIRKAFGPGTCRSEVADPLGDLGRWYIPGRIVTNNPSWTPLRRPVSPANSLNHCPLDSPQALPILQTAVNFLFLSLVLTIYSFCPLSARIFRRKSVYVFVAIGSRTF
jgi:hypothetical protein